MKRKKLIEEVNKYFTIGELVCSHTLRAWGDRSWNFLSSRYLHTLLVLRTQIIKERMTCNTPAMNQRGLRCNQCALVREKTSEGVVYLTQHGFGNGGDFNTVGNVIPADRMRDMIRANAHLLPYNVRIENKVNWLHIDVMELVTNDKITTFDP